MLLKRIYRKPEGWEAKRDAKGNVLNPPPLDHIAVKHTGTHAEQNFSTQLVEAAVTEGWMTLGQGKLSVHGKPEGLVYKIKRAPGHYCCHCGEKLIDANGIDVSDGGMAAIKILAEATKKEGAKVRIRARSSAAAPPKELRSLFRTAGEMNAVRAARVMSSFQNAGVAPARVTIVGDVDKGGAKARGKKPGAAPADRVELEIEPE